MFLEFLTSVYFLAVTMNTNRGGQSSPSSAGQSAVRGGTSEAGGNREQGKSPGASRPAVNLSRDALRKSLAQKKQVSGSSTAATTDKGQAVATTARGQAAATTSRGRAAVTSSGQAAATVSSGQAAATGSKSQAAATGSSGQAAATGSKGQATATGSSGQAAVTGSSGQAAATGSKGQGSLERSSSSGKGKEKRRLEDASRPPRPSKVRVTEGPEGGAGASSSVSAPVEEFPLGGIYVPSWRIRKGSTVLTPEVASEMFEHSCLLRDLQQLSAQGLHVVAQEFASAWARVSQIHPYEVYYKSFIF